MQPRPRQGVGSPHCWPWQTSPPQQSPLSWQNTPDAPHAAWQRHTKMPPEFEVQYGAPPQHDAVPQSCDSHDPAGTAHWPLLHESPVQHAALTPHDPPEGEQLTVLGTHWPPLQRPEQHDPDAVQLSPSSTQPGTPSPHAPPVQRPVQHCEGLLQLAPFAAQAAPLVQRPLLQVSPEQHPPNAPPQSWPSPAQLGVISPHWPP